MTETTTNEERPFDPELASRIAGILDGLVDAIAKADPEHPVTADQIWLVEQNGHRVSVADLTQLLEQLAYARSTRLLIADGSAGLRVQRNDALVEPAWLPSGAPERTVTAQADTTAAAR